jgi:hypothetical protein
MSRKLEKYLGAERKNLDVESPDDDSIWKGIEIKLRDKKAESVRKSSRLRLIRYSSIAAVAIILITLGYFSSDLIRKKPAYYKVTLSSINSRLGQREMEYKAKVSFKTNVVSSFRNTNNGVIHQLFRELNKLDTIYSQSMRDLKELGPNERVINTIFDTYEQKIRLLELIILEINKTESHEKYENFKKEEKIAL